MNLWNEYAPPSGNEERVGKVNETKRNTLPTPPAHHNAPPGTSDAAARSIAPLTGTLRERVLAFIRDRGPDGATDDEGEQALDLRPQTYTPRRGELVQLGCVIDSGRRRPTASGRSAAVWIVPEHDQRDGRLGKGGDHANA